MRLTATLAVTPQLDVTLLAKKLAIRDALREAIPRAAELVVTEAQALVPVVSGNLRDHIHAYSVEDTDTRQVYQVAPFDAADNKYGFDPAYARRIEYGFFGQDSMGRMYNQAGTPYMRPARDTQAEPVKDLIQNAVVTAAKGR